MKRFILTSSHSAVVCPHVNQRVRVTTEAWNEDEEAVSLVKGLPEDMPEWRKGFAVYCASKVKAEQVMWSWFKRNKPSFVANSGKHIIWCS